MCVRNIPYKFALFDDDCLCILNTDSEIETYFVNDFRQRKRRMFITTSIENFFGCDEIDLAVGKIREQFYTILQENQKIETSKIQAMVDAKKNILTQSKKIFEIKKRLYDKIKSLQVTHSSLLEKSIEISRKRSNTRGTDANSRIIVDRLALELSKIDEQQRETVREMLEAQKELDEIYLVTDNILFDNMLMLSKISHNFKVLEKVK